MVLRRLLTVLVLAGLAIGVAWTSTDALGQGVKQPGKNQKNVPPPGNQQQPWQPPPQNPGGQADPGVTPQERALFNGIAWQYGPCHVKLAGIGQIEVPAGYKFTDSSGCSAIMSLTKNLPNPKDMGLIAPKTFNPIDPRNNDWFAVFIWEDIGYVKDDEKSTLDADAIIKGMRDAEVQANKDRAARGFPALNLIGWEQRPFYDQQLNLLSWATRVRTAFGNGQGEDTINYNVRVLGRGGVMSVELVIAPELFQSELPKFKDCVKAYSFQPGQTYAEWRSGDKVAEIGLTALISGGVVAAAAKSGLLGKLGKVIIGGGVAIAAAIGAFFRKIFGRRSAA